MHDEQGTAERHAQAGLAYRKMNGIGNEILILDLRGRQERVTPAVARLLAEEPRTCFDQLMVLQAPRTPGTQAFVRIFNRDGSEVAACGNGTRCVARHLFETEGIRVQNLETLAGVLEARIVDKDMVRVDMGRPKFSWNEIPLSEEREDTNAVSLFLDGALFGVASLVNMGNPHAIFWVEDLDAFDLARWGPRLEHHPLFPEGANISLARIIAPDRIALKVWERGAGLTRACGSAAAAAAVAGARKGSTLRRATVDLPGGSLIIDWTEEGRVVMLGPTAHEHEGVIPSHVFAPDRETMV